MASEQRVCARHVRARFDLYPFLGTLAYLYMVVAVGYLATGQAPIEPDSIKNIASAFMTYYSVRYVTF